jgi:hypothetical protein
MKLGKKSAMARTMRVATTFTGAAACAVAFAPAATAGGLPYHQMPTYRRSGSIRSASCQGRPTWLHIDWYSVLGAGPYLTCVGYKGKLAMSPTIFMSGQCGGNNSGWFFDSHGPFAFRPGTTYRVFRPHLYLYSVSIKSDNKGTDQCH